MDNQDRKILHLLNDHSDMTAAEIGAYVHLSVPAINKRIQKLKQRGVIRRFTIDAVPEMIGKPVLAYMMVSVDRYAGNDRLIEFAMGDSDISECVSVSGEYDYMLKVYTKDISRLDRKIARMKEDGIISKSSTLFALKEYKHYAGPIPDTEEE